ncbi:MAG TPA: hypothetical protein ENI09_01145 [candidate division WWE3 bacterium]|uniref:PnuC protein n=1 Tax=candidate division WWE3 bacterium TaxID=2053526 RepID=A0A7C1T7M1_UNCKA|nr:hypothetical protein [candidate division WWE3 bacterium]
MDWIAMVVTLASSYLLSKKLKWGWVLSVIASVLWMVYGIWTIHSIPVVILNVVLFTIAIRGFRTW